MPSYADELLYYVKVRSTGDYTGSPKYRHVKGGPSLFGLDGLPGKDAVVVCGGEFDATLLWQETGGLADFVATGSATTHPLVPSLLPLVRYPRWLVALDRDRAGTRGAEW
jgi:hypothetical protein